MFRAPEGRHGGDVDGTLARATPPGFDLPGGRPGVCTPGYCMPRLRRFEPCHASGEHATPLAFRTMPRLRWSHLLWDGKITFCYQNLLRVEFPFSTINLS